MLTVRALVRTAKGMQMGMIRPMILGIKSRSPLMCSQMTEGETSWVHSDVFAGTIMARMAHEDSNQYKINVNKNLGPDADPYAHTPNALKEEHDTEAFMQQYFNDDPSVRPYGSFSEQNVAADRTHIDPLVDHKTHKGNHKEKMSEEDITAADSSPIYGGK